MVRERVAAIVPSFDEADRIGPVLKVLTSVEEIDEVIVVDDGSTDHTEQVVRRFPVTYIRHERNLGKAAAMQNGIHASDAEIIFFCDADLRGLRPDIIRDILRPVIDGETDMHIGVRANHLQRFWKFVALLSGERAIRRDLWDQLPDYYKEKFRIEIGLNGFAKYHGKGFEYTICDGYFHSGKEAKYGLVKGFTRRLIEYVEVATAFLMFHHCHVPRPLKQLRRYVVKAVFSAVVVLISVVPLFAATPYGSSYVGRFLAVTPDVLWKLSLVSLGVLILALGVLSLVLSVVGILRVLEKHPRYKDSLLLLWERR